MARVFVGIGSNLRPRRNLRFAVAELGRRFGALTLSPVYRNPAVGFDGADFLNMVAAFDATAQPEALCGEFAQIHELAGRTRGAQRFVSRTLDIDLLLYDDRVADRPPLPRDDILDYAFVLKPLVDIEPDRVHPGTGRTLREHWDELRRQPHSLHRVDIRFDDG
ncbi:MAG: 2-amino-4-hydroxy-6-hydroxymethyldihydropteridine diphosphokinase [Woeseiaceae bacterium]|nr:2-amino-4-hydroxy-6-hydroxymethyldihydropteridine diphosphokinase [Woeseiaceae bacterium]